MQERNARPEPDLLELDVTAPASNRRWAADFSYVRIWAGFGYVPFAIGGFSHAMVGWHPSGTMTTPLVTMTLRIALWTRERAGRPATYGLNDHSDAGAQGGFASVSFAEIPKLEGFAASIGSIGDAEDSALSESSIGLFKTGAMRNDSPFRSSPLRQLANVTWVTAEWVDWYNARRLHSTLGSVPPEDFEAPCCAHLETPQDPVLALA